MKMPESMTKYLMEQLKLHGLSFLLLAIAVWYFEGQNRELNAEIRQCNEDIIEMYHEDRQTLYQIIERNTEALEKLQEKNGNIL